MSQRLPPPADPASAPRAGIAEVPLAIFRFLHSKVTGLVLLLVMAFLALLGTLIAQAPPSARTDPALYAEWLETVRPRYGGLTGVLSTLGLFEVYSSVWFVSTAVLLCLSIVACTAHRVPQLWKRAAHPKVRVSDGFFLHAQATGSTVVSGNADQAHAAIARALSSRRFRVLDGDDGRSLYADRFRWGPFGTAIAHAAFVVIILGLLVTSTLGFERALLVTVGAAPRDVGFGTGLTVEATSFSDTYNPDGSPQDYVSHLVLREDGEVVAERDIRVNTPLRHDGIRLHQTTFGPAIQLTVADVGGAPVFDEGVPMNWTSQDGLYAVGSFSLADRGYDVAISAPASGVTGGTMAPGELTLALFPAGQQQALMAEVMTPGTSLEYGGLTYTFERETKFTGLTVAHDPGAIWVWIGSALLVLGMGMTFGFRHRRLWFRISEDGPVSVVRVASADALNPAQVTRFRRLLEDIGDPREMSLLRKGEQP